MSTCEPNHYQAPCEYTIPIKLHVPIEVVPTLSVKPVERVRQTIPVSLDTNIALQPAVQPKDPVCLMPDGYHNGQSSVPQVLQQS